jgi:dTDP-glucose 4,6-dehydratase
MRQLNKLLVTGGAGFIGKNFIFHLLKKTNYHIVNLDALTYAGSFNDFKESLRLINICGNICNQNLLCHLIEEHEIDTIIHFAAETHVDNSIENPKIFLETNVFGTYTLLEAVKKYPHIHFHHVSTDEVFGSLKKGAFNELSPYDPKSPYSASKASSDHLVRAYGNTYNISYTLSNCSNNFGPYQNEEKFIPKVIQNALSNRPIPIYGNGENVRDWLFVEDHCEALLKILQEGKNQETYLIGANTEISNKDLVQKILEHLFQVTKEPMNHLIQFVEDRKGHDFRYAVDTTKIRETLYWSPKTSLDEGLKKTIRSFLSIMQSRILSK